MNPLQIIKNAFRFNKKIGNSDLAKNQTEHPSILTSGVTHRTTLREYETVGEAMRGLAAVASERRSNAIKTLNWYPALHNNDGSYTKLKNDHWLSKLFSKPNDYHTLSDLLEFIVKWLDASGNAFIYVHKDNKNIPIGLYPIPSNYVTIVVSGYNIKSYNININGQSNYIPIGELIHIKNISIGTDFNSLFSGKSILSQCIDQISANNDMNRFLRRYFSNDGIGPVTITTEQQLSEEQISMIRAGISNNMPELPIIAFLNRNMKIEPLTGATKAGSSNISQIAIVNDRLRQSIAEAFGLPLPYITGSYQNRATAETIRNEVRINTIEPLATTIEEKITNYISDIEYGIAFVHDPFIYRDEETEIELAGKRIATGLTTINEERAILGMQPVPNGDIRLVNSQLIAYNRVIAEPPEPNPIESGETSEDAHKSILSGEKTFSDKTHTKKPSEQWKALYWRKKEYETRAIEDAITPAIRTSFEWIEEQIISNIQSSKIDKRTRSYKAGALSESPLFDLELWKARIGEYLNPILTDQIINSLAAACEDVGTNWNTVRTQFDDILAGLVELSTDKIKSSGDTIDEEMKSSIKKVIYDNPDMTVEEIRIALIEQVQTKFSRLKAGRVNAIAQTTGNFTITASQERAWEQIGGITKRWLSQRDKKVRKSHARADGIDSDKNGYFHIGRDKMRHPCAGSIAEENVNCRCKLYPVFEEDETLLRQEDEILNSDLYDAEDWD